MTPIPRAVLQVALVKAKAWLRRKGVVAVGIGQRRQAEQWLDDQPCIVVKVERKHHPEHLRKHRHAPFPATIEVTVDGLAQQVPVDVQETAGVRAGRCQGCVGGAVLIEGQRRGGAGVAVDSVRGPRLLISGHVAKQAGVEVRVGGFVGKTEKPCLNARLDHCLVAPLTDLPANWTRLLDDTPLAGVTDPGGLMVGQTLYFQRSEDGERVPVRLRQLDIDVRFQYPEGERKLVHLLATDGVTDDGDSGTVLFDENFSAVATLVGRLHDESYFIPCWAAFADLGVSLHP